MSKSVRSLKNTALIVGRKTTIAKRRDDAMSTLKPRSKFDRRPIPPRQQLLIAFDDAVRRGDVARSHKVSPQVVDRSRACAAWAYFQHQIQVGIDMLESITKTLGDHKKADYMFEHVMFDGTKQRISLALDPALTTSQAMAAWEVMVSKRVFVFGIDGKEMMVEWVVPPIPCIGVDANTLYDALWVRSQSRRFVALVEHAANFCKFVGRLRTHDAAKSNLRLLAFEASFVDSEHGHVYWLCTIHQNHLIASAVIATIGLHICSGLYSTSLLMRVGGFFLRMVLGIHKLVEGMVLLSVPAPPEEVDLCRVLLGLSWQGTD